MKVPAYIKEIMERSRYEYDLFKGHENYAAGYTIKIRKRSAYTQTDTLRAEVERMCKWANKVAGDGTAFILDMPMKTHYVNQVAVVTIFDPVMQQVEQFIPKN